VKAMKKEKKAYTRPELTIHGDVQTLTQATAFVGPEDGGNKQTGPHHS
jgi:hypothetical protein